MQPKFFNELDTGWDDLISDVYNKATKGATLHLIGNQKFYKFKPKPVKYSSNSAIQTIRETEDVMGVYKTITFLDIEDKKIFNVFNHYTDANKSYRIKTKLSNVKINNYNLMDILFGDKEIIKNGSVTTNLVGSSAVYMKDYNDYPDTYILFYITYYKNGTIRIHSEIINMIHCSVKDGIDLNKIIEKVPK